MPPELIFDVGSGDLFTIRLASNIIIADQIDQARTKKSRSETERGRSDTCSRGGKCALVYAATALASRAKRALLEKHVILAGALYELSTGRVRLLD